MWLVGKEFSVHSPWHSCTAVASFRGLWVTPVKQNYPAKSGIARGKTENSPGFCMEEFSKGERSTNRALEFWMSKNILRSKARFLQLLSRRVRRRKSSCKKLFGEKGHTPNTNINRVCALFQVDKCTSMARTFCQAFRWAFLFIFHSWLKLHGNEKKKKTSAATHKHEKGNCLVPRKAGNRWIWSHVSNFHAAKINGVKTIQARIAAFLFKPKTGGSCAAHSFQMGFFWDVPFHLIRLRKQW